MENTTEQKKLGAVVITKIKNIILKKPFVIIYKEPCPGGENNTLANYIYMDREGNKIPFIDKFYLYEIGDVL